MDFPQLLLPPPQHQLPTFSMNDDRRRFLTSNTDFLPPFNSSSAASPFLSSLFSMGAPLLFPPLPPSPMPSSSRRHLTGNSDSPKSSLFPPPSSTPFDPSRLSLLPPGFPLPNSHLDSDRYRFILEQQTRERDLQMAMMAAATGNAPPLFTDPNSSALFKPY
jgi:hypothetical protein